MPQLYATTVTGDVKLNFKSIPQFVKEDMCNTIIKSIYQQFEDENNRSDYEQWKKKRSGH